MSFTVGLGSRKAGQEARSAKTRATLIEAAIEMFGAVGYEAASTRLLAQKAEANLSAITYHFGGKRELYLGAAQEIAAYVRVRLGEIAEELNQANTEDPLSSIETALVKFLYLVVDDAKPRAWTAFLARCIQENDDAYLLIHEEAIAPFQQRLVDVARMLSLGTSDDEAIRLRIAAIMSVVASFRLLPGFMLRGMGWSEITPKSTRRIDAMIRDLTRSNFLTMRPTRPPHPEDGNRPVPVRKLRTPRKKQRKKP